MQRSVIIVGNFGATNIGDEALLESILIQLQRSSPRLGEDEDLLFYVLSSNPEETSERYAHKYPIKTFPLFPLGLRSFLRRIFPLLGSIATLRKSSFTLFGGGGLFTDESSLYAVILWWVQFCYLKYVLRQQVHIVGQSIGPLHTSLGKTLTRFVCRNTASVSVRDKKSVELLNTMGIHASYHPDLAFALESSPRRRGLDTTKVHIALSLRPWISNTIVDTVISTLRDIHSQQHILIHLVPMQYIREEDVTILQEVQKQCTSHGIESVLHRPSTYQDVLDIVETCHLSMGMRLHFLILSALTATPCIPLSYSTKVQGVMEELGVSNTHITHITVQSLKDSFNDILEHMEKYRANMQQRVDVLKQESHAVEEVLKRI